MRSKIWLIVAVIILCSMFHQIRCNKAEKTPKTIEIAEVNVQVPIIQVPIAQAPIVKEHILDIPLTSELQDELYGACEEYGVDHYVMVALIERETEFVNKIGDGGASYGYCQIQPRWWSELMAEIGAKDLMIPRDNFRTACAIMAKLTKMYHSTEGALVAYNQGHYRGYSTPYSREVIANAEKYRK